MTGRPRRGPAVVGVMLTLVLAAVLSVYALVPASRVIRGAELPYLLDPPALRPDVRAGWAAFAAGDDRTARDRLENAVAAGAVDPLTYLLLGGVHLAGADPAGFQALVAAPSIHLGQNDVPGKLVRGLRDGDPAEALEVHLDQHPDDTLALLLLAEFGALGGRPLPALADRLEAIPELPRAAALAVRLRAPGPGATGRRP